MRIALIAHANSPWAPKYARIFQSHGHELIVISFHPAKIPGTTTHYVGSSRADGRLPKWLYLLRPFQVRRLLKAFRPDVTLATYLRSNGLIGALTKCSPLVISSRGIDQEFPLPIIGTSITRWVCRRADALHAVSEELRDKFVALGVEPGKIATFPLGTDLERFHPARDKPVSDAPRLICTRKHLPVYDNLTLIRAMAMLKNEGFDFTCRFLGTGPLTPELKVAAAAAGMDERVEFIEEVPYEQVADHLRWADIYLSASLSDGTSSSLLEAIGTMLLPVVTDIEGNRPWITHRNNGYLFATGDARACAEGIRWVWENRETVSAGIAETRDRIDREANLHTNTARLEELLAQAARGSALGQRMEAPH